MAKQRCRLSRVRKLLEELDLEVDSFELDLETSRGGARPAPARETVAVAVAGRRDRSPPERGVVAVLEGLAAAGTRVVDVDWGPGPRHARVRIGEADVFRLPRKLAILLAILAECGDLESKDRFVAWKSKEAIAERLRQETGRRHRSHAITELIRRLRGALLEHRVNPYLVETRRGYARFRRRVDDVL